MTEWEAEVSDGDLDQRQSGVLGEQHALRLVAGRHADQLGGRQRGDVTRHAAHRHLRVTLVTGAVQIHSLRETERWVGLLTHRCQESRMGNKQETKCMKV